MPAAYTAFLPFFILLLALLISTLLYRCTGNVPYTPGP